jgi:hypothetical protein
MAKIIYLPESRSTTHHQHEQDTRIHGMIDHRMPYHSVQFIDCFAHIAAAGTPWGESLTRSSVVKSQVQRAFWSRRGLEAWVEAMCQDDIFASYDSGSLHYASFNPDDCMRFGQAFTAVKETLIRGSGDALISSTLKEWVRDNIEGQHDLYDYTAQGGVRIEYFFKEPGDATLFRLRWTGHDAFTIEG